MTNNVKISDAVRGPWMAVLSNNYGDVYDSPDDLDGDGYDAEIAVVRGSALPANGHMPGSYATDDVLYEQDDFDSDEALAMHWERAKAVAEALNVWTGGGSGGE